MRRSAFVRDLFVCVVVMAWLLINCGTIKTAKDYPAPRAEIVYGNTPAMTDGLEIFYDCAWGSMKWANHFEFQGTGYTLAWDYDGKFREEAAPVSRPPLQAGRSPFSEWLSEKLLTQLKEETPEGQSKTRVLRVADYTPLCVFDVTVELPGISGGIYDTTYTGSETAREIADRFRDFFQIPVPENEYVLLMADKREAGSSSGINYLYGPQKDGTTADSFGGHFYSAYGKDALYLSFHNRLEYSGAPADCRLIPGGYGIYRLPLILKDDDTAEIGAFVNIFPLPGDAEVLYVGCNASGSSCLTIVQEESGSFFAVLDGETGELRLRIELPSGELTLYEMDNGLSLLADNRRLMVLYEVTDGNYEIRLDIPVDIMNEGVNDGIDEYAFWYENSLSKVCAFDGQRLAKICFTRLPGEGAGNQGLHNPDCGFGLIIYNREGIAFCGSFDTGLDRCNAVTNPPVWQKNIQPLPKSLQMHWVQ